MAKKKADPAVEIPPVDDPEVLDAEAGHPAPGEDSGAENISFPSGAAILAGEAPAHAGGPNRILEWLDPTPEMLQEPAFDAVWERIKAWDINVPGAYTGYMGATGNHVRAILDAIPGAIPYGHADLRPNLRLIAHAIYTLVYGCDSQRARQDAAAPAIEILDRLIGA